MDAINAYVRSLQKSPKERAGAIHPSTLGKCARAAIYEYRGFEPDREWNDRELRVFTMGYRVEDFVADALDWAGELIARNVPLMMEREGVKVVGELDLLLRVDGGWCIADVKSVHSDSFGYGSFPYEHHCYQVGAYGWALERIIALGDEALAELAKKLKPKGAPEGWESWYVMLMRNLRNGAYGGQQFSRIIYVSKDDLRVESVTIASRADLALAEIGVLADYIKLNVIPDRPFQSPEEHAFACAKRVRKGRYNKKKGCYTPGQEPLYVPKCRYFKQCWGVMPAEWHFWEEVDEAAW